MEMLLRISKNTSQEINKLLHYCDNYCQVEKAIFCDTKHNDKIKPDQYS